jgi:3-oxoacyl-(acyl-carrier-protein) synthase
VAAVRQALAEAAVPPGEVDFVNAHGTGTPLNDAAEWQALVAAFDGRAATLPVTAVKASVGHLLGAAGALEAVATVLTLLHGRLHPAPAGGTVDPAAPAHLLLGEGAAADVDIGISVNLAFGGSNAALLFQRWAEQG